MIPSIGLAKSAGDAVANGENFDITFTFVYENNGTVDLTTLTMMDDIMAEFGNAFVEVVPTSLAISGTPTLLPGVNTGWETDTSLDMLDGTGRLNVGESFEVSFTVTIDPDGIDSVSQGLENQGTAGGVGINPVTDTVDPTLVATDESDNGTDPGSENGDEETTDGTFGNDPTPIVIADVSAAKEVVGTPTLLANGNFEATYQVVIENTGTVDLASLTLDENLATQFGAAYVDAHSLTMITPPSDASSAVALDSSNWNGDAISEMVNTTVPSLLAVGDSFILQFTVEIDAAAATGVLDNTVTVGGAAVDENGDPIENSNGTPITATDNSDSGSDPSDPNSGEPGDTGGTDDPTPLYIPAIGLAKEAGDAVANGDNFDVTFTLNWENTGTVALDGVEMFDDIATQFGGQFVAATVDTVTTSGTAAVVANAAWGTSDTTVSMITHTGDDLAVDDTIQVVFTVTIDPDVSGTSSTGLANQATSNGTGVDPETGAPDPTLIATDTSDNGTDPTSENGEEATTDGTFGNDPTPIIIPDISVAKAVVGSPVPLGNGNFNVTYQLVIENTGNVDLADLTLVEDLATQYGTALLSAGNITLVTAPADASSSVSLDSGWDGNATSEMIDQTAANLLAVGDTFTIQFTTDVDPDAVGAPVTLENQVTAGGDAVDANGDPLIDATGNPIVVTDDSDNGTDPNSDNGTGTTDDPTPLLISDLTALKSVVSTAPAASGITANHDVTYEILVTNTGNATLDSLTLAEDFSTQFGNAYVGMVGTPVITAGTGAIAPTLSGTYDGGSSDAQLFDTTSGELQTGESYTVTLIIELNPDAVGAVTNADGEFENTATAGGDDPSGNTITDDSDDPTDTTNSDPDGDNNPDDPTGLSISSIAVEKQSTGLIPASSGVSDNFDVTYEFVITNTGSTTLDNLTLTEDFATQFGGAFVGTVGTPTIIAGTGAVAAVANAAFDGGASDANVFDGVSGEIEAGETITVSMVVELDPDAATAVYGPSDQLENQATAAGEDPSGNTADDLSDDPNDASNNDSNSDGEPDDPTGLQIVAVDVEKSLVGQPVVASSGTAGHLDATFELTYTNTGSAVLNELSLTDDLATQYGGAFIGIVNVSLVNVDATLPPATNPAFDGTAGSDMLLGSLTDVLEPGQSFTVSVVVEVFPSSPTANITNGELLNSANAAGAAPDGTTAEDVSDNPADSTNADPDADNNPDDPTALPVTADLVTIKTLVSGDSTPNEGDTVSFQIAVTNDGAAQATSVSLTDLLPSGLTATANNGTVSQGAYDPITGDWTVGIVPVGTTAILTLEGTVNVGEGGNTIANITSAASGDQPDPSTAGDDLDESVQVVNDPPIVIDPDPTPGTPSIDPLDPESILVPAVDGTPITIDMTDYLTDPNGHPLTITPGTLPPGATYDPVTNTLTFIPSVDNVGDTVIPFTVTDGNGGTTTPTVTIQAVNPAPEAMDETVPGAFETPTVIDPLANDTDPDGDPLTLTEVNGVPVTPGIPQTIAVPNGTVTIDANGVITVTPDDGYSGVIDVPYTIVDQDGATATATHTVDVPNAPPEPTIGLANQALIAVEQLEQSNTIVSDEEYERYTLPQIDAELAVLKMSEGLNSLNSLATLNLAGMDQLNDEHAAPLIKESYSESEGFSSGKGYRGTISVDPTDDCGRFFIDTIVENNLLAITARSTIDPSRSSGVVSFSATLANGDPLPEWISELADGEYLLDRAVDLETVALKMIAHREDGSELIRFVEIDTLTGQIREQEQASTFSPSFYEGLEQAAINDEIEKKAVNE